MRTLLAIILTSASLLPAANHYVRSSCSGYTNCISPVNQANLQTKMNVVACGDTLHIEAGQTATIVSTVNGGANWSCSATSPITIRTDRDDSWLPEAGMRITPGYAPLLPRLIGRMTNGGYNPVFDWQSKASPIRGVTFKGLAFEANHTTLVPQVFMHLGSDGLSSAAELPSDITVDRTLFFGGFTAAKRMAAGGTGMAWRIRASNINFNNNYLAGGHAAVSNGQETYYVLVDDSLGNDNFLNNYFSGGVSSDIFIGGSSCCLFGENPSGITVSHNIMHTPNRYFRTASNYIGVDLYTSKNGFEEKIGSDTIFSHNTVTNQWSNFGSQYYGVILKMYANVQGPYTGGVAGNTATLNAARTTVTLSSNPLYYFSNVGQHLCFLTPAHTDPALNGFMECRQIVTANAAHSVFGVSPAFSSSVTAGSGLSLYTAGLHNTESKNKNSLISGNFFLNVARATATVSDGWFNRVPTATYRPVSTVPYVQIRNNLQVIDSPHYSVANSGGSLICNVGTFHQNDMGQRGYTIANNTQNVRSTATQCPTGDISGFHYGQTADQNYAYAVDYNLVSNIGFGGARGFAAFEGAGGWARGWARVVASGVYSNNIIGPGTAEATPHPTTVNNDSTTYCLPNKGVFCRNNTATPSLNYAQFQALFRDPANYDYTLVSPLHRKTGHDGSDPGVDMEQVPVLRNVAAEAGANAIFLKWRVPAYAKEMGATVEVSASASVVEDDAEFTVVNAVNPAMFKRSDSDRSNPRAVNAGIWRYFQVGENSTATDDNGVSRSLALTPSTLYHYRIQVGGAVHRGSIATAASENSGPATVTIQAKANTGTKARVRYGETIRSLTTAPSQPCSAGCTFNLPGTHGRHFVYYVDELDGSDNVVYTQSTPNVIRVQ